MKCMHSVVYCFGCYLPCIIAHSNALQPLLINKEEVGCAMYPLSLFGRGLSCLLCLQRERTFLWGFANIYGLSSRGLLNDYRPECYVDDGISLFWERRFSFVCWLV